MDDLRTGNLRHVLTVQYQSSTTDDGYGGTIPVWATYATVRAEKRPLFGRDMILAQSAQSVASAKYKIRYLSGLNSTMRIVEGGVTYEIIGEPVDVHGQGKWHEVLCKTVGGGA